MKRFLCICVFSINTLLGLYGRSPKESYTGVITEMRVEASTGLQLNENDEVIGTFTLPKYCALIDNERWCDAYFHEFPSFMYVGAKVHVKRYDVYENLDNGYSTMEIIDPNTNAVYMMTWRHS